MCVPLRSLSLALAADKCNRAPGSGECSRFGLARNASAAARTQYDRSKWRWGRVGVRPCAAQDERPHKKEVKSSARCLCSKQEGSSIVRCVRCVRQRSAAAAARKVHAISAFISVAHSRWSMKRPVRHVQPLNSLLLFPFRFAFRASASARASLLLLRRSRDGVWPAQTLLPAIEFYHVIVIELNGSRRSRITYKIIMPPFLQPSQTCTSASFALSSVPPSPLHSSAPRRRKMIFPSLLDIHSEPS